MKLKPTILPAKVLKDGTHRVRIAMSHRGATRYFMTRFIVSSPNNLVGGAVSGIPNASYINQQLLKIMSDLYKAYDEIEDTDYLTCSQLLDSMEKKMKGKRPTSIYEAMERFLEYKKRTCSASSIRIISTYFDILKTYFTDKDLLKQLDSNKLFDLRDFLSKKYNSTTQSMMFIYLRMLLTYAIRNSMVEYAVHPYRDFEMPKSVVRNIAITIEQLRQIRDMDLEGKSNTLKKEARDFFMLSFYLCGMNLVDLTRLDFSKPTVRFLRQKTASRRQESAATEFTIQPEAHEIIDRLFVNGKWANKRHNKDYITLTRLISRKLKDIAKDLGFTNDIMFYSARKTFAQISNELMIKDGIIEYCIGDSVSSSRQTIGSYIKINRRMADAAIRKVFDAVASDKSMDELIDEATR